MIPLRIIAKSIDTTACYALSDAARILGITPAEVTQAIAGNRLRVLDKQQSHKSTIMGYDLLAFAADSHKTAMKHTERPAPAQTSDLIEYMEAMQIPVPAKLKPRHWTDRYRK